MCYPRTPTTTTSAATTTPNVTPNELYAASPATPTDSATPSASTPSKPPRITHRCFSHRYFRREILAYLGEVADALASTGIRSCSPATALVRAHDGRRTECLCDMWPAPSQNVLSWPMSQAAWSSWAWPIRLGT